MAFLDVLKGRKREEGKPERLQKGAFSPKALAKAKPLAEKRPASPKASRLVSNESERAAGKKEEGLKTKQSVLAAEFLLRPHITEQSNLLAQKNIYTFRVSPRANKIIIKKVIEEMYGFEPVKVRVINVPPKKRIVRGKTGTKHGFKKALVYLKKGDKIEFI